MMMMMMMMMIIIIIIIKEMGVKLDNEHWYDHAPKSVEKCHECKIIILWNQQVRTERTTPKKKPDIIIRDNKQGTCILIEAAICGDRNVIKKEPGKILKYKDFIIEIQRMSNVKTKAIPVIAGATGTISKSLRQYLNSVPGKHEIKELKKAVILGIALILRKVLM